MWMAMADHPWCPRMEHTTCDFTYLRLLGRRGAFPDYSKIHRAREDHLEEWANLLRGLPKEVARAFVFINNQSEGHSPTTARKLLEMLGEEVERSPMSPSSQEGQTPRLLD